MKVNGTGKYYSKQGNTAKDVDFSCQFPMYAYLCESDEHRI